MMSKPLSYTFILGLMILCQVGLDLYAPSMPAMQGALHSTANLVQASIAVYLIACFFSQLILGTLSDYYGRRRVLIIGLSLFCLASMLTVVSNNISLLLLGRFLQGAGIGLATGLSRAIARDLFSGKALAHITSYQSMAWAGATLTAPLLGGYIQSFFGWRMNFIILLVLGLLSLVFVLFKLRETNQHLQTLKIQSIVRKYKSILTNPVFVGSALTLALSFSISMTVIQLGPFLFQNLLHLSPSAYGWIPFTIGVASIAGAQINIYLLSYFKINSLILSAIVSNLVLAGIAILIAVMGSINLWVILIPLLVARAFGSWIYANSSSNAMQPFAKNAGAAGSLLGSTIYLGAGLCSLITSHLSQHSELTLFGCIVGLNILILLSYLVLVHKKAKQLIFT